MAIKRDVIQNIRSNKIAGKEALLPLAINNEDNPDQNLRQGEIAILNKQGTEAMYTLNHDGTDLIEFASITLDEKQQLLTGEITGPGALVLNYTTDLANGNTGSTVSTTVSANLLDAITKGKPCIIQNGDSNITANLQKTGNQVVIVMQEISKIGEEYMATNTSITVNTAANQISNFSTGTITLVDKPYVDDNVSSLSTRVTTLEDEMEGVVTVANRLVDISE